MANSQHGTEHSHASSLFSPRIAKDLLRVRSRRWFLQAGIGGLAGLSMPQILKARDQSGHEATSENKKSVILFWLSGGPSQIDMWDPKPDAPSDIRGPFNSIETALPGVRFSEHLPLQASIADKLSIIRSVDCSASNHTPITMQCGNPLAKRSNDGKDGGGFPSMGSVAAKFRGSNDPDLPGFVGLANSWTADVYGSGNMGPEFEPVKGLELAGKFNLPSGVELSRLGDRNSLRSQFDQFRRDLDQGTTLARADQYSRKAFEMVASGRVQKAFNMDDESQATRDLYGTHSVGQKALLARRLVESGVTFVLVSGAWGYFDHHGDEVRWGGIEKGLKPLSPRVDQAMFALINDLETRGLLDSTFVMMMGEFGRGPVINKNAGRDHWLRIMSMITAGGGMPTGQVIGSSDRRGGDIKSGLVRPQDLAATTFQHLGIDLNAEWVNQRGRPIPIVQEGGRPIPELL